MMVWATLAALGAMTQSSPSKPPPPNPPGHQGPAMCFGASALKHRASKPKIEERDGRYFGRDGHQTFSRSHMHMDQPAWLIMLSGQYDCVTAVVNYFAPATLCTAGAGPLRHGSKKTAFAALAHHSRSNVTDPQADFAASSDTSWMWVIWGRHGGCPTRV